MGLVLKYTAVWRICARRHQDENVYIMEPRQKCQNSGRNLVAMGLYWNGSAPNYTNNIAQMQQRAPAAGWAARLLHKNTPQKQKALPRIFPLILRITMQCVHRRHGLPLLFHGIRPLCFGNRGLHGRCINVCKLCSKPIPQGLPITDTQGVLVQSKGPGVGRRWPT